LGTGGGGAGAGVLPNPLSPLLNPDKPLIGLNELLKFLTESIRAGFEGDVPAVAAVLDDEAALLFSPLLSSPENSPLLAEGVVFPAPETEALLLRALSAL